MKSGTRRYTVEVVLTGQPRPYANSVYEFVLTTECIPHGESEFRLIAIDEVEAKRVAQAVCMPFKERGKDNNPEWFESTLREFETISPGMYRLVITQEYTG